MDENCTSFLNRKLEAKQKQRRHNGEETAVGNEYDGFFFPSSLLQMSILPSICGHNYSRDGVRGQEHQALTATLASEKEKSAAAAAATPPPPPQERGSLGTEEALQENVSHFIRSFHKWLPCHVHLSLCQQKNAIFNCVTASKRMPVSYGEKGVRKH